MFTLIKGSDRDYKICSISPRGKLVEVVYCDNHLGPAINVQSRIHLATLKDTIQPHKKSGLKDLFDKAESQQEQYDLMQKSLDAFLLTFEEKLNNPSSDSVTGVPSYFYEDQKVPACYLACLSKIPQKVALDGKMGPEAVKEEFKEFQIYHPSGGPLVTLQCHEEYANKIETAVIDTIAHLSKPDIDFQKLFGLEDPNSGPS